MAIFLGVHKFSPQEMNESTADQTWEKYKIAARSMGLTPLKVLISYESGESYCQTEADTEDQVKEAHNKAEIPIEKILKVQSFV